MSKAPTSGIADRNMQRIALLMGAGTIYGREITLGVSLYARPTKPWLFNTAPPQVEAIERLKDWKPSGIIAHVSYPKVAKKLLELNVPVVNISNILGEQAGFPCVIPDDTKIGKLAANHFLERGFENYAFCGVSENQFSKLRFAGFRSVLVKHDFEPDIFEYPFSAVIEAAGAMWGAEAKELARWIENLPKPVAIFAAGDLLSFALSEVCNAIGVHIPEQVALLGVDNDSVACELAYPRLSSVDLAPRRIGYEAAKLLDSLLNGADEPQSPKLLAPSGIEVRHSSDITAIDDKYIAMALRFIRERADKNINVSHVLEAVPVSRRDLERRFKKSLGRSILEEIRSAHIQQAKKLLAEESLSLEEVSHQSGFASQARFSTVFRQITGQSPSEYRKQYQTPLGR